MLFCFQRHDLNTCIADGAQDVSDDYRGDLSFKSLEFDPCISTNKLR